jgi:hypothetical protein
VSSAAPKLGVADWGAEVADSLSSDVGEAPVSMPTEVKTILLVLGDTVGCWKAACGYVGSSNVGWGDAATTERGGLVHCQKAASWGKVRQGQVGGSGAT